MVRRMCFAGLLVVALLGQQTAQTANILAVFAYTFGSSYVLVRPYLQNLVQRGHQLTVISAPVSYMGDIEGVQHIRVESLKKLSEDLEEYDYETEMTSKWAEASFVADYFYNCSKLILDDPGVRSLLQNASAQFSMVILEAAHTDALYGFAKHYNASLVGISAFGGAWNIDFLAGNSAPSVYEPMSALGFSRGLSLVEKMKNLIFISEERLVERFIYLPGQIELYKRYFSFEASSLHEIRKKFSLILLNQHFSLGRVRSNVPNLVEVGGMHLSQKPEPLSAELQGFLDEAVHGAIYFSMNSDMLDKWLPPNMQKTMLKAFARLKQRVVWRTTLQTPNESNNLYVRPWHPQREILNHPNVKLYITQGGLLSIIEASYYAVPTLCIPIYYDQFKNADRLERLGMAKTLDIYALDLEEVVETIHELLNNDSYAKNAKELSIRFNDQPMTPMETAIWWTEYVLRHKGADHMRIVEQDMSLMQYYSVDIFSVLFGRIGLTALIVIFLGYTVVTIALRTTQYHLRLSIPVVT
ncbi:UDP-glucuronosyltransferase 1-9 [Drosophila miranda]|uniref:UDP-glucuronosyltransferase 1-9 n=1 Tax=Drosophila miranda TaxID=7229 RepID=UPI0007E71367|nr:UDP-glucuronosyltransferase 1-9 [Drosophila miranda]